ncbi:RNA polymerase sigma factor [Paenibacillus sp. MBLB4367]|uniref:RNA polymerase sigma factor n=1 Tax=Paenibacillus sp. MBLB4367 TaxID=3384767 RepID=UPI0039083BC5
MWTDHRYLIEACKRREPEAIEIFFDRYQQLVYRTALLLTRNPSLADDAVQDTFLRVLAKLDRYDPAFPLEAWLYRVSVNVTKNLLRKHKIVSFFKGGGVAPQEQRIRGKDEPSYALLAKERDDQLWERVLALPYKNRVVIVMKYYHSLSQEQIAESLRIPVGTVKSRLFHGLRKLRKGMETKDALDREALFHYE